MKRICSIFLAIILTLSICTPVLTVVGENEKIYKTIYVEYSDNLGVNEQLDVMVKDNNVYVDASQIASRLGYTISLESGEYIVIYNDVVTYGNYGTPRILLKYFFNSCEVNYLCYYVPAVYEAPFQSIEDDKGIWVPFKYTLYALNSNMMIVDGVVQISMPHKNLNDLIFEVAKNNDEIQFDYFDDAYFEGSDLEIKGASSHIVNLFSGILNFEGESWMLMFQQFTGDLSAYDAKYGEKVVKLFCTNSDKELEAINKQISAFNDIFSEKGNLGKALTKTKFSIDSDVNSLYNQCQMIYENIDKDNVSLSKYNAKYQQFERAFDKQTWFSNTGEVIIDVQKEMEGLTKSLEVLGEIAEVTGYISEFTNKDAYAVDALNDYLSYFSHSTFLSDSYTQSLKNNAGLFKSNIAEYAIVNYIKDNVADWIKDGLSVSQYLSSGSNLILLAWNIASNTIPFIKNGLSSADNFELSLYSNLLQGDSLLNYRTANSKIFSNEDNITSNNAYKLAQCLYTYLKSAYITRDAAVGSFDDVKNKEGAVEILEDIASPNKLIADYLAQIKMMSKDNLDFSIGFFKDSSDWLVENYNDSDLLKLIGLKDELVVEQPTRKTSDERDIVLVLDVSGSMSGTPLTETKKAATKFINTILKEDASISIVSYSNSASVLSDFSMDEEKLTGIVSDLSSGGSTNIDDGLSKANELLQYSNAEKKIIVLMSDGEPNLGREGDELVAFADSIKDNGTYIYTLGFFASVSGSKSAPQLLMERIASEGCHYEVANADDLVFFFGDIADKINGQKYIYVRIACPVEVTVTYQGETLSSAQEDFNGRTSYGSLTLEDIANSDDKIKTLRLKEGQDYKIHIQGTARGKMDYTIGYMDDSGEYSDMRSFEDITITRRTLIDSSTKYSERTVLKIDEDGDGRYDMKYRAGVNGQGKLVDYTYVLYIAIGIVVFIVILVVMKKIKNGKKRKAVKYG